MENPLKKKKHRFRNFIMYLATYIAVTFSMAFVTVSVSDKTYSANIPDPIIVTTWEQTIGNLMEIEDGAFSINATANNSEHALSIAGDMVLKFAPGFSDINLSLDADIIYNNTSYSVILKYTDGKLYAGVNGYNYSITTQSLITALGITLSIMDVDMGFAGDMLSSLDPSILTSLEGNITETVLEDGYALNLAVTEEINVDIMVDSEYKVKDININNVSLSGFNMDAQIGVTAFNDGLQIEKDDENFVDITPIANIYEGVVNRALESKYAMQVVADDFPMQLKIDRTSNLTAQLSAEVMNIPLALTYINDTCYLDLDYVKLKSENVSDSITTIFNELQSKIDVPEMPKDVDYTQVLYGAMDTISKLNVNDFYMDDNQIYVDINGVRAQLVVNNRMLTSIVLVYDTHEVVINFVEYGEEIEVKDNEFISVSAFSDYVMPVYDMINNKKLSANITINYNGLSLAGELSLDFTNCIVAEFVTYIGSEKVIVHYENDNIYLQFVDIKIVTDINSLLEIADYADDYVDTNISLTKDFVKLISQKDNEISLNYGDIDVTLGVENNALSNIQVGYNEIGVKLQNISYNTNFLIADVEEFEQVSITKDNIQSFISNITSGKYSLSGSASVMGHEITYSASIDMVNGVAKAELSYGEVVATLFIQDGVIYADINTIKVNVAFDEIEKLIGLMLGVVETPEVQVSTPELTHLGYSNGTITAGISVSGEQIEVALSINNNTLQQLSVSSTNVGFVVKNDGFIPFDPLTKEQLKEYSANVEDIANHAMAISNVVATDYLKAQVMLNMGGESYEVQLTYVAQPKLIVKFETTIENIHVWGYYTNNILYVNVFDICFSFDMQYFEEYKNDLFKLLGINQNDLAPVTQLVEGFSVSDISQFVTTGTMLKVVAMGYDIKGYFLNNKLTHILVNHETFNLQVRLEYVQYSPLEFINNREIRVDNVINLAGAMYNTFKNTSISGTIDINFPYGGENNYVQLTYGISYNEGLLAYIKTTFKGLYLNAYVVDSDVYINVAGMKLHININELPQLIGWVNGLFDTNLPTELETSQLDVKDFSFEFLTSARVTDDTAYATLFGNLDITAKFGEAFEKITFEQFVNGEKYDATIHCNSFKGFLFDDELDVSEYMPYTSVTSMIDSVMAFKDVRTFDIMANASVVRNGAIATSASGHLQLDITDFNDINAYISASSTGETSLNITGGLLNHYIYVDYEGLKLAMHESKAMEILGYVMSIVGMGDMADKIGGASGNVSSDNLTNLIPSVDFGNPLEVISMARGISITDNTFVITLRREKVAPDSNKDIVITITFDNNRVSSIAVSDLYSAGTFINISLALNEYVGVTKIENTGSYLDITDATGLIRAFINTSALNDFYMTGDIAVSGNISGIDLINKKVKLDAYVKMIDDAVTGKKKPVVAIALTKIPVISLINNDLPGSWASGNNDRALYVYIMDGMAYLYRHETFSYYEGLSKKSSTYEKKLMVTVNTLFSDPLYYLLQYGVGLGDMLMKEIYKAIQISSNREEPMKMSNILLDYQYIEDGVDPDTGLEIKDEHQVIINLREIANNANLDKGKIFISTRQETINGETLDYLNKLRFTMNMPLTDSIQILLDTQNLTLTNIGSPVDVSGAISFMNNYTYPANMEYEAVGGKWNKMEAKQYTITFDANGANQSANPVTAYAGESITLPTLNNYMQVEEGVKITYYTFGGWSTSPGGSRYTESTMPRGNSTLYAIWNKSYEYYYTISFDSMGGKSVADMVLLEGDDVVLPTLPSRQEQIGNATLTYTHLGWYLDKSYEKTYFDEYGDTMIKANITLYAKWSESEISYTSFAIRVYDNGVQIGSTLYSSKGAILDLSSIEKISSTTLLYSDANYSNPINLSEFVMPEHDIEIHIRNYYTFTLTSKFGENIASKQILQGDVVVIPNYNEIEYTDDGTQTERVYYKYNGYIVNNATLYDKNYVMANNNITATVNWTHHQTKKYYTVSFNTKTTNKSMSNSHVTTFDSIKVLEGEVVPLSQYTPTCTYWVLVGTYKHDFLGWKVGNQNVYSGYTMPANDITLTARWSDRYWA